MFLLNPDQLQFKIEKKTNDDSEPIIVVTIGGFADEDEANLFGREMLMMHGEKEVQTIH
jgi:hypothetical protein|tara:strand:+ start:403 stop:579 length:177 start_codon:yes stop_codon:yes gene_type:complete